MTNKKEGDLMANNQYLTVDSIETLEEAFAKVREAQKKFATYTQEQVDKIFLAAATAANKQRIPLAKMAVAETGMGIVEDKVIKLIQKANNRGGTDNISVAYLIRDKEGDE